MTVNNWFVFWIKTVPLFTMQSHHKLVPTSADPFSVSVIRKKVLWLKINLSTLYDRYSQSFMVYREGSKWNPYIFLWYPGLKETYLIQWYAGAGNSVKEVGFCESQTSSLSSSKYVKIVVSLCHCHADTVVDTVGQWYSRPWLLEMLPIARKTS